MTKPKVFKTWSIWWVLDPTRRQPLHGFQQWAEAIGFATSVFFEFERYRATLSELEQYRLMVIGATPTSITVHHGNSTIVLGK